jgi:hypothetical protein
MKYTIKVPHEIGLLLTSKQNEKLQIFKVKGEEHKLGR